MLTGKHFQEIENSEAWKFMKKILDDRQTIVFRELMKETDFGKMRELQGEYKGIESITIILKGAQQIRVQEEANNGNVRNDTSIKANS